MKSILAKLSADEIKELSKALNEVQKKSFGNPLSLRKQEQLMADLFETKDWSTLLGLAAPKNCPANAKYQKTIVQVEILSTGPFPQEYNLLDLHEAIFQGECSGRYHEVSRQELSEKEMEAELITQGTDPSFLISNYEEPTEEILNQKSIVFHKITDLIEDEDADFWLGGKVQEVADRFFKIFRQERYRAISKFNRLNSETELETLSEFEKILSEDKIDFTTAEVIARLREM